MGLLILAVLIVEIFTVAIIGLIVFLAREWWLLSDNFLYDEYAQRCLIAAIVLIAFSLSGKWIIAWMVSSRRKNDEDPRRERSNESETIVRPDGSKIYIEYFGQKDTQPIIFVHGWNANSMEWYYQRKYFSREHRVILFDLPGLGKSTRPDNKDFSLPKMAADLEAVINHTGVKDAILFGHSMGGMTILTYCVNYSEMLRDKVKAIILEHTTYTDPTRTAIFSRLLSAMKKPVLVPICWIIIVFSPLFWISKWVSYMNGNMLLSTRFLTFTGTQSPRQLDFIAFLSAMASPAVFARGMLAMFKTYDVTNELQNIKLPALIIAANKDMLTKATASEFMASKIPNAEIITVAPAGHQGLIERHAEVNKAAADFIKRHCL